MTVIDVSKDPAARTMTMTAAYDAPVDRVWQLWADPRLLERWWGPPTYPATVTEHDLAPGGRMSYFMTGPEGDQPHGWWQFVSVDAPHRLEFQLGFADQSGEPTDEMPATIRVELQAADGGTRMEVQTTFPSAEAMTRTLSMGMEEGMREAMGQTDGLLAEAA